MNLKSGWMEELHTQCPDLECRAEEPLAKHTSFRIGGPAEWMLFPKTITQLRTVLAVLHRYEQKPLILGAGTNVLAPDAGVRGVVLVTRDCLSGIRQVSPTRLEVMAGTTMAKAAMTACDLGLSGLEFAHGIPGTVGGGAVSTGFGVVGTVAGSVAGSVPSSEAGVVSTVSADVAFMETGSGSVGAVVPSLCGWVSV